MKMLGWLLIFCGAHGAWAADLSEIEIKAAVEQAISQRHDINPPQWWRDLGPQAPRVLMEMYGNEEGFHRKQRILHGLGFFDDPEAVMFLQKIAKSAEDPLVRHSALYSLGESGAGSNTGFFSEFLSHDEEQTRFLAARGLKRLADDFHNAEAAKRLVEYQENEKVSWIGEALDQYRYRPVAGLESAPRPTAKAITGKTEKAPDPRFGGTYTGYWLAPGITGPAVTSVVLEIAPGVTGGSLTLQPPSKKAPPIRVAMKSFKGQGQNLEGILDDPQLGRVAFRAKLLDQSHRLWIQMSVDRIPASLLVSRKPTPKSEPKTGK